MSPLIIIKLNNNYKKVNKYLSNSYLCCELTKIIIFMFDLPRITKPTRAQKEHKEHTNQT